MNASEYETRLRARREEAKSNPAKYRAKIRWALFMGYAFLAFFLLLGVLLVLASVGVVIVAFASGQPSGARLSIFLFIGGAALVFAIGSALATKSEDMPGKPIPQAQFPALWNIAQAAAKRLDAQPFDEIRLITDTNAAVGLWRKYSLFGVTKSVLLLGAPLLLALDPEMAESVILHEAAHLAHGDSVAAMRQTFVNQGWRHVYHELSKGRTAAWGARQFAAAYVPWLNQLCAGYEHQAEFQADRASAKVIGVESVAAALCASDCLMEVRLDPFVLERGNEALPPDCPTRIDQLNAWMKRDVSAEAFDDLKVALFNPSTVVDSHPCLADRLKSAGQTVVPTDTAAIKLLASRIGQPVQKSAWEAWMTAAPEPIQKALASGLEANIKKNMEQMAAGRRGAQQGLDEILAEEQTKPLDSHGLLEKARHIESVQGSQAALPHYEFVYTQFPGDRAIAEAYAGCLLYIDIRDTKAAAILENLMASQKDGLDEDMQAFLIRHYCLVDQSSKAYTLHNQIRREALLEADVHLEMERPGQGMQFQPYTGSVAELDGLIKTLRQQRIFREAYVAYRVSQTDRRVKEPYVIMISYRPWYASRSYPEQFVDECRRIAMDIPVGWKDVLFPHLSGNARKIRQTGRLIWKRGQ